MQPTDLLVTYEPAHRVDRAPRFQDQIAAFRELSTLLAFKHAFPQKTRGEIRIELRAADGVITLHIRDTGVGMRTISGDDGLGLKLIVNSAAQLRGTLSFDDPSATMGTGLKLTIRQARPNSMER